MKNLFYINLTLMVFLLVSSCEDNPDPTKSETTTVKGIVIEYGTEEPIAGAEVKMVNREAGRDTVAITTPAATRILSLGFLKLQSSATGDAQ